MKRLLPLHLILILFAFCTSLPLLAQQTHEITLYVDTENIDMRNLEKTCNFGQDEGISNEDYTVDVNVRDTVVWVGKAINNRDIVEIKKIIYSSGTNFFSHKVLRDNRGIVTGVIVINEPDAYQKYNIEFKVKRNGSWLRDTFPIDPKLRMKTTLRDE